MGMVERWSRVVLVWGLMMERNGVAVMLLNPPDHTNVPLLVHIQAVPEVTVNIPDASVEAIELCSELIHQKKRLDLRRRF